MKRYIYLLSFFALAVACAGPLFGASVTPSSSSGSDFKKVGAAGAQFLKIGVGARATGMAGAFSGVSDDITSIYWNPAGIAYTHGINADFSYTRWFAGLNHAFAAASMPIGDQFRIAASMTSFSSGNIEITTLVDDQGTGGFYNLSDYALGLTFGGKLTDQFSFGVNAKYIQIGFSSASSSGLVFDIGTMYETNIEGIRLGFSVNNLGGEMQYTGSDLNTTTDIAPGFAKYRPVDASLQTNPYSVPLSFRAGLSSEVWKDETNRLLVAGDFETLSDTPEQYAIGAEYTWENFVSVRAGYRIGQDNLGLAGGVGLKYESGGFKGILDYSINTSKYLGLINRLSLGISLD